MSAPPQWLAAILLVEDWAGIWLALFGLAAQAIFMMRMIVQWLATERARRSVVPEAFWWMSLAGSVLLLVYGALRADIVIIAAQAFGFIVYIRNLWFIRTARRTGPGGAAE
jgi:lipid-A-disaccharide synthase-like uncharacterized protein